MLVLRSRSVNYMAGGPVYPGPYEYYSHKVLIGEPESCWEWKGSCGSPGYGNWCFSVNGLPRRGSAHRRAYILFNGDCEGKQVNHSCGNRKCCNPNHLYAGSQKENHVDTVEHGRHSPPPYKKGSDIGTSKLTESNIREIKKLLKEGKKGVYIARKFNVTTACISAIKKGTNWKWVE